MGFMKEKGITLEILKQQYKGRTVAEFCVYHHDIMKSQIRALESLNNFKGCIQTENLKYVDDYFKYSVVYNFQFKSFWKGDLAKFLDVVEACFTYEEEEVFAHI